MIKRTTICAFILLALFTVGVLFRAFYSSKTINIEETLTEAITLPQEEDKYPHEQRREGVSKDLWVNDRDGARLHHHIKSPHSTLIAISHGNRMELVEQMTGMECYFQEKLEEEGFQQIRYLQSEDGTYHYTGHFFDAPDVFLALYRLSGKKLPATLSPKDAYLEGVANKVSLSFSGGSPSFHADKFKAEVRPQKKDP
ncbi:hypothetical protein [Candidatus Neptunochlamydia vexilliferae]|uniref:Uncharacterized protein n=1 Tax=Candidatus Neptunichlamydia vexilliferae TaxID=1651774 RepID=A0ABS0AZH6_9BACT|nr:hypothetical protein [Candidatus Neptunochlamydia vexilliferae]MBF5059349.1 hypothetical protein [Candidatus Neptunochlamydia vexilliferae]